MEENTGKGEYPQKLTKISRGVFWTLVLGALGSAVWEIIFRPGFSMLGSWVTEIWERADNAVFENAALDPRPLPSLILMLVFVMLPMGLAFQWPIRKFIRPLVRNAVGKEVSRVAEKSTHVADFKSRISKKIDKIVLIATVIMLIAAMPLGFIFIVYNEAIIVWRAFHRNIEICAPYTSQVDKVMLMADFRRMERRSDFVEIKKKLDSIAQKKNISLKWHGL